MSTLDFGGGGSYKMTLQEKSNEILARGGDFSVYRRNYRGLSVTGVGAYYHVMRNTYVVPLTPEVIFVLSPEGSCRAVEYMSMVKTRSIAEIDDVYSLLLAIDTLLIDIIADEKGLGHVETYLARLGTTYSDLKRFDYEDKPEEEYMDVETISPDIQVFPEPEELKNINVAMANDLISVDENRKLVKEFEDQFTGPTVKESSGFGNVVETVALDTSVAESLPGVYNSDPQLVSAEIPYDKHVNISAAIKFYLNLMMMDKAAQVTDRDVEHIRAHLRMHGEPSAMVWLLKTRPLLITDGSYVKIMSSRSEYVGLSYPCVEKAAKNILSIFYETGPLSTMSDNELKYYSLCVVQIANGFLRSKLVDPCKPCVLIRNDFSFWYYDGHRTIPDGIYFATMFTDFRFKVTRNGKRLNLLNYLSPRLINQFRILGS